MNFMQAVEEMKKGKKVRRKDWKGFLIINERFNEFWICMDYTLKHKTGNRYSCDYRDFEATDWEVVEEKESLSLTKRTETERVAYLFSKYMSNEIDLAHLRIQINCLTGGEL